MWGASLFQILTFPPNLVIVNEGHCHLTFDI